MRLDEEGAPGRHVRLDEKRGRHVRHTSPDEQLGARPEVPGALELKAKLDSGELTYTQYQVALLALEGRAWPHAAI